MKISVVTPTYNRKHTLGKLYDSLKQNIDNKIAFEWLIMDDGSTDNTESLISEFILENKFPIKYFNQKNQGKMKALNNLIPEASGDLIVEIDSDDFFTPDAFKIIAEKYNYIKDDDSIYGMVFLRTAINATTTSIDKNNFKTTMFDLYFKHGLVGDTTMVFKTEIRKKYYHKLEKNEKFITEARMYNEIEKNYNIVFFKNAISICEYLEEGYSKNIYKEFFNNPFGYYHYFKEMFEINMNGILLKKRLYIIKHYILFSYLTKQKHPLKYVKGLFNKLLATLLFIPGYLKSWLVCKNNKI